jgi:hypothetical protein
VTKQGLAANVGRSETWIHALIKGDYFPAKEDALKIVEATNGAVSLEDLIPKNGRKGTPHRTAPAKNMRPWIQQFKDYFSDKGKHAISEFAVQIDITPRHFLAVARTTKRPSKELAEKIETLSGGEIPLSIFFDENGNKLPKIRLSL